MVFCYNCMWSVNMKLKRNKNILPYNNGCDSGKLAPDEVYRHVYFQPRAHQNWENKQYILYSSKANLHEIDDYISR